jgi:hypothetical protein
MRIRNIDFGKHMVEGPKMVHWSSAVCHDNERPLTTKVVDEKLEEGIYCKSFVYVADWIEERGSFQRDHANP